MNVAPRCRRNFLEHGQGFCGPIPFISGEQSRQDGGIVVDDDVRDETRALVADFDFDVRPARELFLATDLGDGGA